MKRINRHTLIPLLVLLLVLAGCTAPAAQPAATQAVLQPTATQAAAGEPSATNAPTAAPTAAVETTPAAGVPATGGQLQFVIVPEQSEARYRIREQLANMDLPIDAVGATKQIEGAMTVNADGTIDPANSKITVNMASLTSDRSNRDNYVRRNILLTDQYPEAVFVAQSASGLPSPLPSSGPVSFQVTGDLTIRDVTQSVTWEVTGTVDGGQASGTATTSFPFELFNLPQPRVPIVLSVNNEIKLEVDGVIQLAPGATGSIPTTGDAPAASDAPQCTSPAPLTPPMTEGPYYSPNPPEAANLYQEGMNGTKLTLTGYVLDQNCQPVSGARVDFWQADANGVYDNTGYTLRGYQLTDANGRYRLVTVIPGQYPGRTEHLHLKVQAPGGPALTSQLFFPDAAQNQSDRIFDNSLLVKNFADGEGGKVATFDFVIATQ